MTLLGDCHNVASLFVAGGHDQAMGLKPAIMYSDEPVQATMAHLTKFKSEGALVRAFELDIQRGGQFLCVERGGET